MMFHGIQKNDVDARWKSFHVVKAALQNQVQPTLPPRIVLFTGIITYILTYHVSESSVPLPAEGCGSLQVILW